MAETMQTIFAKMQTIFFISFKIKIAKKLKELVSYLN